MRAALAAVAMVGGLVACGIYDAVPGPGNPFGPGSGLPDAGLPNLPDGGFNLPDGGGVPLPDGGFGLPDGGWPLPDGGWSLPDGGFGLPDGGFGQLPPCPSTTCVQELFSAEQGSPQDLALTREHVYWSNPSGAASLARRNKSGSPREVLYDGPLQPALQVDEALSYFATQESAGTDALVRRYHPGGSSNAPVARWPSQALRPGALAQNGTTLFALTAGGLVQAAKDGTGARVLLGPSGLGAGLAADEAGAYVWYAPSGELLRVPTALSSDGFFWVATPPSGLRVEALHAGAGLLYAVLAPSGVPAGECSSGAMLARVPTGGGAFSDLGASPGCVVDLASDAQHLYWLASVPGQGTLLLRAPLYGGPAWQLAQLQGESPSLAVDDAHVYWSEPGLGRIMRMAKPR